MTEVQNYINEIEECRLFEATTHSMEDMQRTDYYIQNAKREAEAGKFANYEEYLKSLDMKWEFQSFEKASLERIVQLINKTNQFNLTTLRLNLSDVISRQEHPDTYLCIQGRMSDKFGDNGIVTLLIGKIEGSSIDIELWLMSCRVFRRNGEQQLFTYFLQECKSRGIKTITGRYLPTAKNGIVKDFYGTLGFVKVQENSAGEALWKYEV
jgi:FkbH-like protein